MGVLALANGRGAEGFSERDEQLLLAFCEYGSVVLSRARDLAARLAMEEEANRRRREVEALLEAAAQLNREGVLDGAHGPHNAGSSAQS